MNRVVWVCALLIATTSALECQTPSTQAPSTARMSRERTAIYRAFLQHYDGPISNLLNMEPDTIPFEVGTPAVEACLLTRHISPFGDTVHELPTEIIRLETLDSVTRRIRAAGNLVPANRRTAYTGPDGYVLDVFTLSEIVFDAAHRHAAFSQVFFATSMK